MSKREQTAANTAEEARLAIEQGLQDLADRINKELPESESTERLRQKSAELAEAAKDVGRDYANHARLKGHEYSERAKAGAGRLYDAGHEKADEAARYAGERYDDFSEVVRRNPAKSIGIAASVGFFVGLIMSRR